MKEHEFTLILAGVDVMTEDLSNRLYGAGCDDGSPYSSQGVAGIRFHRQAATLEDAIRSAVADIGKAGVAVERLVIEHDELASI
jgi:hypothetical protein